uniref:Uncharacterized protein n=1 Tax=Setaria viridis TaxID=4556 RepID=A0A4V6D287_SETVI|nr:hypothetical protein SEVIR_9G514850v2 [Setaria viridis]
MLGADSEFESVVCPCWSCPFQVGSGLCGSLSRFQRWKVDRPLHHRPNTGSGSLYNRLL